MALAAGLQLEMPSASGFSPRKASAWSFSGRAIGVWDESFEKSFGFVSVCVCVEEETWGSSPLAQVLLMFILWMLFLVRLGEKDTLNGPPPLAPTTACWTVLGVLDMGKYEIAINKQRFGVTDVTQSECSFPFPRPHV